MDCENLYLRKTLFEEFWNEKLRKAHEIKLKKEEKELLIKKIQSREVENAQIIQKKSELKLSAQLLYGIDEKIATIDNKIRLVDQQNINKTKEQLQATQRIMNHKQKLSKKEETFERYRNQKDFYKSQQIKDMHRKQDLKLKIKFFLDKVLEQNNIDRGSIMLKKSKKGSGRDRTSDLPFTFSQVSLSEDEKKRLNRKKKKYSEKNAKVDEGSRCGGCQSCRVF
jgi:hypothetical protein